METVPVISASNFHSEAFSANIVPFMQSVVCVDEFAAPGNEY